jgi:hypothetical protein
MLRCTILTSRIRSPLGLYGSLNAGEAVLLDTEYLLMDRLCSNVTAILQKQLSPFSSFIDNFYVLPRPDGIQVPWNRT